MKKSPKCYIIAGPNGAGKTTFAMQYLPQITDCQIFVNADEIARGLSPLNPDTAQLQAGKLFLSEMKRHLTARDHFAFETTLSGKTYLPQIRNWKKDGWKVILFYLYIPSSLYSKLRVEQRVLQGGHSIPEEAIIRRYPRSIRNLFEYADICDETHCLDNSDKNIIPIFDKDAKGVYIYDQKTYLSMREFCHDD